MPTQIDLKYATINIDDGGDNYVTTGAGIVNNVSGYAIAATSIIVSGLTSAVEVGGRLVIGANSYVIASSVGGVTPTTIVIAAPGLVAAIVNGAALSAIGKVNTLSVKVGSGNLTFSEKRSLEYITDRGLLDDVREGDQVPMDCSMQFVWDYIKGTGAVPSIRDALRRQGAASTWRSSDADTCRPYAVNIRIYYTPNCTGAENEKIVLEDFRWEEFSPDLRNGQISVSGKCNQTQATITRGVGVV